MPFITVGMARWPAHAKELRREGDDGRKRCRATGAGMRIRHACLAPDLPDGGFEIFQRLSRVPLLSASPIIFIARRSMKDFFNNDNKFLDVNNSHN
jgi:hypothetical protein